ncbi:hypothetical protein DFA_03783 [Cavenderia fasciculata]|uniref:Uncharacterized protein n=1 Tax=Cavenderia fasciculata TaxID=261658 RepID=F4Q0D8_CACFS|nr:uncharacterized protein DFA_03783 [Cavenderia fasciculata]EGG18289.1 hypothetical protein DFA_03783 [Cavenderia fasciculata]|eukprot:XP_004357112.1 hypothetical protein DFA_03783 [Cavenderia fasciculata]
MVKDISLCVCCSAIVAVSACKCINSRIHLLTTQFIIKGAPTILHIFDTDLTYYALNISSGDLITKQSIPLPGADLVELNGVILPSSTSDEFLLIGGNITDVGQSYIPIIWSYNVLTNTLVQKSFIDVKFQQIYYQWGIQIASYDSINNIVYLNADFKGYPVLLKFDYNQQKEEVISLPGTGWYIQSSYNETTNMCYLGGTNQVANQFSQMVVATYNSVTGNTSSHIITFDVPDSCYYSIAMYQYNSKFYAGLYGASGSCPSFIFEVDIVGNTTTLLATIQKDNAAPFDSYIYFVFDNINGYLAMVATSFLDYTKLEICMVNLNTYEVDQYTLPNILSKLNADEEDFLMTLSN